MLGEELKVVKICCLLGNFELKILESIFPSFKEKIDDLKYTARQN